ncbi:MAG: cation:proton antiporter [Chloroflexi bacterium]|nr:cation:proton antiporter [Chloroflexota bacterium]
MKGYAPTSNLQPPTRTTSMAELIAHFVLQVAAILFAAKLGGEVAERWLRQPAVLGELAAGILIGPFALGGLPLPLLGQPLFGSAEAAPGLPVSTELFALAQVGAVVLLFLVGLETDLRQFLRYGVAATAVAAGGVLLPFGFGALATVLFGIAPSWTHPSALFMGAIMTATSVGITARVLSDIGKLDTAEGVTVLGGAVVDDVLGILVLAITVGIAATGSVSLAQVGLVAARAIGFWLALTLLSVLLAGGISRLLLGFRAEGATLALALALALFAGFLAESFGLALIIGAYSVGLGLSRTELARAIVYSLRPVYHALVPIFFVVMGMLVDLSAMGRALEFGLAISALAIVGKLVGAALPALAVGFNLRGATRIGLGMLPRGEVALIVAGVGLTSGVIGSELFGVAILMTVITTFLAPVLLVPAFQRGGSGRRGELPPPPPPEPPSAGRHVVVLEPAAAQLFTNHLERLLVEQGFASVMEVRDPEGPLMIQYQKDHEFLSLALYPPREDRQELAIEFEAAAWQSLVAAAVREAARAMVLSLLSPIDGGGDGIAAEVRAALADLLAELERR